MYEESGYEILVNLKWPHQGFCLGWDIIPPNEEEPYNTVMLFLGPITFIINWD